MITYGYFPSLTNQAGKQYLLINSEGGVHSRIYALDAGYVKLDTFKDDQDVWTGESRLGYHYYQINIDCAL